MTEAAVCALEDLGLLCVRGPDARKFLQGQLSNDVTELRAGSLLRAGMHNPQGRTLALLALAAGPRDDEILAVLPHELLAGMLATLKRYVLRAKVTLSDESAVHRIYGIAPAATTANVDVAATAAMPAAQADGMYTYEGGRCLAITPAGTPAPAGPALARSEWQAFDIAAGLPQLYLPTSGQFVAQMLNLDQVGAVSFKKGCYTGQEVIARAHYRGRVKRRMQRFLSEQPLHLVPGDAGQFADGRSFRVIQAVTRADGRAEFLAVAPLPGAEPEPPDHAPPTAARVEMRALALPYPLTG